MSHGIDLDLASVEQWARQKESIGDFLIFHKVEYLFFQRWA